ncbi:TetR/AcrR family transcriptional regulator [Muricauda oceani]|uniref:TetR/AcrR family transcriptional regulator n=1 Tax=Flagellimonas oceani TaxID=2698672 RepID=A0A6G7J023_9FLAO|nr:TetR/AcrR family transcriptional regulator [Allomuricauda oceani]MBW8243632.1 TetR/AcrR family transcriptional regulator [Allomuricauda oceani]QII44000.1 TetR/AcrR family transcriptional regulator [Allomuricauda oceani]
MRPQKIQDEELLSALSNVFRTKGYEGASLKELSEATGLQKASLYHRFPNGKKEMAEAVLADMDLWVTKHIFKTLEQEGIPPSVKLKQSLDQISKLYNGGKDNCIFRALSMQEGFDHFHDVITKGFKGWLKSFTALGLSVGQTNQMAEKNAIQTLIDIQGSLMLCKGMQDTNIFINTLKQIEERYN